ncbi:hypothetical protein F4778DRAFT_741621 [Xylariomycetidae sp. FL2044]|nr:hypothetical protein F4778DRAFT_741621 [Xylariomycetidae sp. FL2044]
MPADRLLNTVLRAYQEPPDPVQTDKILASTSTLLTSLSNPLNLSLLTSHFLTARAIWQSPDRLQTCLRAIGIYNAAAIRVRRNEQENAAAASNANNNRYLRPPAGSGVRADDWARAIARGADERSARWQHLLVLTGVLVGMEADDGDGRGSPLSRSLRSALEQAVVTAANLALRDAAAIGTLRRSAVALALSYALPLLSPPARAQLDADALLRTVVEAMLGDEGFRRGDFILELAADHHAQPEQRHVLWNVASPSVVGLQRLEARPLVQNMGPLSRLAAFAVQHAKDPNTVLRAQDELLGFTRVLLDRWMACSLSVIDPSRESRALAPETLRGPWAALWRVFQKIMYTVIATLHPMVARSLLDPALRNDATAPRVASKTLHILRNLAFVSSRRGAASFQVYTFVYLTSIDILTRYPDACVAFLRETLPPPPPQTHAGVPFPASQALALFYLNTAEHLTLALPTPACEELVVAPAAAYLSPSCWLLSPANTPPSALTRELFEAAHAALLSALSCPQHGDLAASLIPFYVEALLSAFPARVSPRQFRLAFRAVVRMAGPPHPLSASHPDLAETLLEMLRFRSEEASTIPILPHSSTSLLTSTPAPGSHPNVTADVDNRGDGRRQGQQQQQEPVLSEQATLVLALIDALPYLPLPVVEDWLARAADAANRIRDPGMRETARRRLWDVLASGEMDVERAAVGVSWWGTGGGREMVSGHGKGEGEEGEGMSMMMSGALMDGGGGGGGGGRSSRL